MSEAKEHEAQATQHRLSSTSSTVIIVARLLAPRQQLLRDIRDSFEIHPSTASSHCCSLFPKELEEPPGRLPFSQSEEQTFQNVHYSPGKKGSRPGNTRERPARDCEGPESGEER